jgi:hypothetical protein
MVFSILVSLHAGEDTRFRRDPADDRLDGGVSRSVRINDWMEDGGTGSRRAVMQEAEALAEVPTADRPRG